MLTFQRQVFLLCPREFVGKHWRLNTVIFCALSVHSEVIRVRVEFVNQISSKFRDFYVHGRGLLWKMVMSRYKIDFG